MFVTSLQIVTGSAFTGQVILSTDLKKRRNTPSLWPIRGDNMESRKLQLDEPYQHLHKDTRNPRKSRVQVFSRSLTSANITNPTIGPANKTKWQSYNSFRNTNVKNTTVIRVLISCNIYIYSLFIYSFIYSLSSYLNVKASFNYKYPPVTNI